MNMKVDLCGVTLNNPVMTASGTFGSGAEYAEFVDLNKLGAVVTKGVANVPWEGNPTPRVAEVYGGMLNAIGLQNPGIDNVISKELPKLKKVFNKKVIANINGFSVDEYVYCAKKIDNEEQVGIIEANISCPNIHNGGENFASNAKSAAEVTRAVKSAVKKPVYVKLSPNVTDIAEIAKACEAAGADGISMINTLLGMRIDLKTQKPVIKNKMGGFSGKAVFPVAVRMVYQVYEAVKIPIIGIGGIASAEQVIEMMLAGASAVQIGAANLTDPFICPQIISDLPKVMEKYNIEKLTDIIGGAHNG